MKEAPPPPTLSLLQLFKRLGSHTVIDAMQQIEVPRLAVTLAQLGNSSLACLVLLLLRGTVLRTRLPEFGEVVDYFLFRLFELLCAFIWYFCHPPSYSNTKYKAVLFLYHCQGGKRKTGSEQVNEDEICRRRDSTLAIHHPQAHN